MNLSNIARPYARAAFEYAHADNQLSPWSDALNRLAELAQDPSMTKIFGNPKYTVKQLVDICIAILPEPNEEIINFIKVLAENQRLPALAEIARLFTELREENEKVITAQVYSAVELNSETEKQLADKLSKKLNRAVRLEAHKDENIIGGLLIRAGDLVIDGTIRGEFAKLRQNLLQR